MNRRDLLKSAASGWLWHRAARALDVFPPLYAQRSNTLNMTLHGPSIFAFAKDGKSADVSFTAFKDDEACDVEIHLPYLRISDPAKTKCITNKHEGETEWCVAGFKVAPAHQPSNALQLEAPGFKDIPISPNHYPKNDADWISLKWLPLLDIALDSDALAKQTMTSVPLRIGTLMGTVPYYAEARGLLWTWQTKKRWDALTPKQRLAEPNQALTDQAVWSVPYSGSSVKLNLTPLIAPEQGPIELEFTSTSGQVDLELTADPASHKTAPTQPLMMYCGFYQVADPTPPFVDRRLPYEISTFPISNALLTATLRRFSTFGIKDRAFPHMAHPLGNAKPTAKMAGGGQPTPKPFCGGGRVVLK